MAERSPLWIVGVAALLIAAIAFGIGQVFEGGGIMFVLLATSLMTVYSHRKWRAKGNG